MDSPFVRRLLMVAPELRAAYDEHLRANDELLPHVFMGDVTRIVVESCDHSEAQNLLTRLLNFFETELSLDDDQASELVYLGFCENLIGEDHAKQVIGRKIGPRVLAAMRRVRAG